MAPGILETTEPVAATTGAAALAKATEGWDNTVRFYLNGTKV
jgi:hypothetical protein